MTEREWEDFISRYYESIYSFCFHYTGRHEDAEDVTQEVFLRAFSAKARVRENERAWLYSIARNRCADRYRSLKRFVSFLGGLEQRDEAEEAGELGSVRRALVALPKRQKEVFILRHWHGFDTAETAKLLQIEEGTVKSHLKRAIESLRRELLSEAGDEEQR